MGSTVLAMSRPERALSDERPTKRRPTAKPRVRGFPNVDERLVMPDTRYEVVDGKVEHVPPADEAHGSRHSKISALLEVYTAEGYDVASDMLTRTSKKGDMAPDASVFPRARDPRTGGRQLEELAFEVVHTEGLGHAAAKARSLVERGVRRVFAIDVEHRRALAWSRDTNGWEMLPHDGVIEDPALSVPLPIRPLVEAMKADDAVAQALIAKKNPVVEDAIRAARLEGKVEALLAVLAARGVRVSKKAEKQVRAERNEATIDAWLKRAARGQGLDELLKP